MKNKTKKTEKTVIKNDSKPSEKKNEGGISQSMIRKGLTIAVMIFAALLIISISLIFVVSQKIDSMSGADAQIKLSAQASP